MFSRSFVTYYILDPLARKAAPVLVTAKRGWRSKTGGTSLAWDFSQHLLLHVRRDDSLARNFKLSS
jgi:hypothetical protein